MTSASAAVLVENRESRQEKGDYEKRSSKDEAEEDVIREYLGMKVYSIVL